MTITYKMVNPTNGASITSTEKYMVQWLARGFVVVEIIMEDDIESSNNEEVGTI